MFQSRLVFLPDDAVILSDELALVRDDGYLMFFGPGGPVHRCAEDDLAQMRLAQGVLSDLELAKVSALAHAFGVSRTTIYSNRDLYRSGDLAAFRKKRGPRAAHKLTGDALERAQQTLDEGRSQNAAAREAGVSGAAISHAVQRGALVRLGEETRGSQPSTRSAADGQCSGGVAVKRVE